MRRNELVPPPHPLAARVLAARLAAGSLCVLSLLAPRPAAADEAARSLAHQTMEAMGGEARWAAVRLLRFDFTSRRDGQPGATHRHWWDRHTGAYRLEGTDREGRSYRVLFDVDTREGRAWRDGVELAGDDLAALLTTAYGRFINDSYWLLMPWKWLDPGVVLAHEGSREIEGSTFEVVSLAFGDGVGLTSSDRYWAFVSPTTGLMDRWAYVLQDEAGAPGGGEPTSWAWDEWRATQAGIRLSTVRRRLGGPDVQILFPVAEAWSEPSEELLREAFSPSTP